MAVNPFTPVQAGPACAGTGQVQVTTAGSPATPSGDGTMLTAVVCAATLVPFIPPNPDWRLAKTVPAGSAGHLERWYLEPANNPGGITSVTFSLPSAQSAVACHGSLNEVALVSGWKPVIESTGQAAGTGASMPVNSACGNVAEAYGIVDHAAFFTGAPASGQSWTLPGGYSLLAGLHAGGQPLFFHSAIATGLTQGNQALTGGLTGGSQSNLAGWCAGFTTWRAVRADHMALDGAEMSACVCVDPTGQVLLVGGDVEDKWRSVDGGDHWRQVGNGDYDAAYGDIAAMAWSLTETNTVYALVGAEGAGGGFEVSTDGGLTWAIRSAVPQFAGATTAVPPRVVSQQDADRSAGGHLIAQDATNGHIYVGTYNQGVMRSEDHGVTWTTLGGLPTSSFYIRALAVNPAQPKELWVAVWNSTTAGGIYHTADATVATPTWDRVQLSGSAYTGTVADLIVVGGYLYAGCQMNGLYRAKLNNPGQGSLASLNGTGALAPAGILVNNAAKVNGIDGYTDTAGNHQILVAQGDGNRPSSTANFQCVVQVTLPGGSVSGMTWADLTNTTGGSITLTTLPPDGRLWWHLAVGSTWQYYLGATGYTNGHIAVDPINRSKLYVVGAGGFFRSYDGGTTWQIAVNGMAMHGFHTVAIDPNDPTHAITCGSDFTHIDTRDITGYDASQVVVNNPGPNNSESHGGAFDPVDSMVVAALNKKYGANANGYVYPRAGNTPATWGQETGYGTAGANLAGGGTTGANGAAGGNAPLGVYLCRDGSGNRVLLVIAMNKGMYRATSTVTSGVPTTAQWTWTPPAGTAAAIGGSGAPPGMANYFTTGPGGVIYVIDRNTGIYRSTDYGVTWVLVWAQTATQLTVADTTTGFIAANPNVAGELWVSTSDTPSGLYKLAHADTGTVKAGTCTVTAITDIPTPAGLAFYAGAVYVIWQNYAGHTAVQLMTSTTGAIGSFTDAGYPELSDSVATPHGLYIAPSGMMMLTTGYNTAQVAQLAASTLPALSVVTTTMLAGSDGLTYGGSLAAVGGSGTGYVWSLNSGSLPAGLTMNPDGTFAGTITGVTESFTAKVTDSLGNTAVSGTLTITVAAAPLSVTTTSVAAGTAGTAYGPVNLTASGGSGTGYTWALQSGSPALPAGMTLSSGGALGGTATSPAAVTIDVQVTDSASNTAVAALRLVISAATPLACTTTALAAATAGDAYDFPLGIIGGQPPYDCVVINTTGGPLGGTGNLPDGFTLSAAGVLSGESGTPGFYPLTFSISDSAANNITTVLTLVVLAPAEGGQSELLSLADGTWALPSPYVLTGGEWVPANLYTLAGGQWS